MTGRAVGENDLAYHGGALDVARLLAPTAPGPWVDLSTGISPYAYPLPDLPHAAWTRLPEAAALAGLERSAAERYGARPECVVAGPGSQALVHTLARMAPKGEAMALAPTYSGHAEAFAAAGLRLQSGTSIEALADCAVGVVVNPNNPDGRVTRAAELLGLAERIGARGGWLIVDEAFADLDPTQSLAPRLPDAGVIVLRSFGKTYGLAGLRLGFAIASPVMAPRLRAALGPWPVSGPAIAIGAKALADSDWLRQTSARLRKGAARLDSLLEQNGWILIGGTSLFRLARKPDARAVFHRLLEAGILTRLLPNEPDRIRFGLPGAETEWRRLAAALAS
jgi:cobalamin biosynthesis protein CobC